jgi:hypothetical protein
MTDEERNEQELWFPEIFYPKVSDERPLYDECGCIYPCPDHKSPAQDGQRDREYWSDRYAE